MRGVPGTDKWHFPPPPHIAHVKSITLHPTRAATLFACIEQGALLTSEDDGESWKELDDYSKPDDPTYRDTHHIELHPEFPAIAYLTTGVGTYRSEDGGRTWRALTQRGSRLGYPDFIFIDPQNPDIVYVAGAEKSPKEWPGDGTGNSAVLKSTDGGATWRELKGGLPARITGSIEAMSRHRWPGGKAQLRNGERRYLCERRWRRALDLCPRPRAGLEERALQGLPPRRGSARSARLRLSGPRW